MSKEVYVLFDLTDNNPEHSLIGVYTTRDKAQYRKEEILKRKGKPSYETIPENLIIVETYLDAITYRTVYPIWETDGKKVKLPDEVKVPITIDADEVADYLSDEYGWLVKSFVWKRKNLKNYQNFSITL